MRSPRRGLSPATNRLTVRLVAQELRDVDRLVRVLGAKSRGDVVRVALEELFEKYLPPWDPSRDAQVSSDVKT